MYPRTEISGVQVRVVGGAGVRRRRVRSARGHCGNVHGSATVPGHRCGRCTASGGRDAERRASVVQRGHEEPAQGTLPTPTAPPPTPPRRQTVNRPTPTDHRQSDRTPDRRHPRAAARQHCQRHHVGDHVYVGHR